MFRNRKVRRDRERVKVLLAIIPTLSEDLQSYKIAKAAISCLENEEIKGLLHESIPLTGDYAPFVTLKDGKRRYCSSMSMQDALKDVTDNSKEKESFLRWQQEAKETFKKDLEKIRLEIMRLYGI